MTPTVLSGLKSLQWGGGVGGGLSDRWTEAGTPKERGNPTEATLSVRGSNPLSMRCLWGPSRVPDGPSVTGGRPVGSEEKLERRQRGPDGVGVGLSNRRTETGGYLNGETQRKSPPLCVKTTLGP